MHGSVPIGQSRPGAGDSSSVPYPGIPAIVDGSEAVAHVETRLSEVACVYPITASTARTEGRFAKHFGGDGSVTPEILATQADRLANWRTLQEIAGLR